MLPANSLAVITADGVFLPLKADQREARNWTTSPLCLDRLTRTEGARLDLFCQTRFSYRRSTCLGDGSLPARQPLPIPPEAGGLFITATPLGS